VVVIRNLLYDAGIFTSHKYQQPIISIGNLAVGGTGKSPMTEYLIRLLKKNHRIAVLSRGYGRNTKGFILADTAATATQIGDEPAQFKQKFPDVTVAVCEKRVTGIDKLLPDHDLILMDDAYQHRAVKPGLSILLFDFNRINEPHLLLPAGNMREPFGGRSRADLLIVTKCPPQLTPASEAWLIKKLKPFGHQSVFFTSISYQPFQELGGGNVTAALSSDTTVFLLTGIANPKPLLQYINQHTLNVIHHNYADHHQFSLKNIAKLAIDFSGCPASNKVIITTEKDAQRLRDPGLLPYVQHLPVWVLPIGIQFLNDGAEPFNQYINKYVSKHTTHYRVD
jgi:tetraacyldisaccharide 4'-kinase